MIMKLKMEILIWKLVHRALLLAVGSAILAFGISCRGAKVLASDSKLNPAPTMGEKSNWGYEIKFPQSLFAQSIGHQVTFMMTAIPDTTIPRKLTEEFRFTSLQLYAD